MSAVLVLCVLSKAQPPSFVPNSPASATRADKPPDSASQIVNACAAAADELQRTRVLVTALENENSAFRQRLDIAVRTETVLNELIETRRSETEALKNTLAAKNETIAAKNAALARQDEFIVELKRRKSSPWKRLGDVLIGVAAAAILK